MKARSHQWIIATLAVMMAATACERTADIAPLSTSPENDPLAAGVAGAAVVGALDLPAAIGVPFTLDVSTLAFAGLRGTRLIYAITFAPLANGLVASSGRITGTPLAVGTTTATIVARDATGRSATRLVNVIVRSTPSPITVASANTPLGATAGTGLSYDATKGGSVFTGGASPLTYAVSFAPAANGLTATNGRLSGVPTAPDIISVTITARDAVGQTASNTFPVVTFASDLVAPTLTTAFNYSDATAPIPAHFNAPGAPGGPATAADNTPLTNAISNAGATLGRVLFYDRRLSANDRVACASCHLQQFGFGDTAQLSLGFAGGRTGRHSMNLSNARFYARGHFFWDERANTLEDQVLQPIQNAVEMGMTLPDVVTKVMASSYYAALFQAAFGTSDVTSDRISRALAQYVRSLVSAGARYDRAFTGGAPNFPAVLTPLELQGQQLFNGAAGCARCHQTEAFIGDNIHNTGLDVTVTDVGAGSGRFKTPSLRNAAIRGRYMHDGRFTSLDQVVEFYNSGIQNNPNLDGRLRLPGGGVQRLNLTANQKSAIVAFIGTLTDSAFIANPKFASPFAR